MRQRINLMEKGGKAIKAMFGLSGYLAKSEVGQPLLNLIYYRVSQINGCAYCLDMHSKDLLAKGEDVQRLLLLDAWREASLYTDREMAALTFAEELTKIPGGAVSDEVFEIARKEFSETELIDLTMAIITINSYNRINIAFRTTAGSYQPGKFEVHA